MINRNKKYFVKITAVNLNLFYLHDLKKIIPILLLLIISINHLNIIDAVMDLSVNHKKDNIEVEKGLSADDETEKDNSGKDKTGEEKYYSNNQQLNSFFVQAVKLDKFIFYSAPLNTHPVQEGDTQPPWTA